jgi:hypothetical protein
VTVTDARGRSDDATINLQVEFPPCPTLGEADDLGFLQDEVINEASGLAESRQSPGVLWLHNDSGGSARLFAVGTGGELLATVWIDGANNGDWEDLSLVTDPVTGVDTIVIGDVGDNGLHRETVDVYLVDEPSIKPGQKYEEITVPARRLELDYPDYEFHNVETLLADPVTGDILLVTKDYAGETYIFRKQPPHVDGEFSTLEAAGALDFSTKPLSGNATTAGDVSPLGDLIVVRTYTTQAYVWRRDATMNVAEALAGEPCEVELPAERQGETIAFSADGASFFTISEGTNQPIYQAPIIR